MWSLAVIIPSVLIAGYAIYKNGKLQQEQAQEQTVSNPVNPSGQPIVTQQTPSQTSLTSSDISDMLSTIKALASKDSSSSTT